MVDFSRRFVFRFVGHNGLFAQQMVAQAGRSETIMKKRRNMARMPENFPVRRWFSLFWSSALRRLIG
jgi:hypothetical protein